MQRISARLSFIPTLAIAAVATVATPAWSQVTFTKSFTDDPVAAGDTVTLEYTITNNGLPAVALTFTDDLDAALSGLQAVGLPSLALCGGASVISGTSTITLVSGALLNGQSCTFPVTLQVPAGAAPGSYPSTTSDLMEAILTVAPGASDTLQIVAPPTPSFSLAFAPNSVSVGVASTLTFTIDNSGAGVDATSLDFTDNLPAGLLVAATPNASTTCTGGALTATGGASSITYSGGTANAGGICTVQVDVVPGSAGSFLNTTGDLTSSLGNSGTASGTLNATSAGAPTFSKAFAPSTVSVAQVATVTFTIDNSAAAIDATSLDFTDPLPTGLLVAPISNASTTCTGGSLTAIAGTTSISYSGGTVSAGSLCTIQVDVIPAAAGSLVNTTGDLTSSLGNSGPASATLNVNLGPVPAYAIAFSPDTIQVGDVTTLTFTIDNTANAVPAANLAFADSIPAGLEVAATPNASTTCIGGTLTATAGSSAISYSGGTVLLLSSCTVQVDILSTASGSYNYVSGPLTSLLGNSGTASATLSVGVSDAEIVTQTHSVIRNFMRRRADLITAEEPDLTSRIMLGGQRPLDVLVSQTGGKTELSFSTSLAQLRGALADADTPTLDDRGAPIRLAEMPVALQPDPAFDIWAQGTFASYRDTAGGTNDEGLFGLLYVGAEWRPRPGFALGLLTQVDMTSQRDPTTDIGASGTGWMAGPYVAGHIGGTLFQLRGAYGTSRNEVSPFGTYEDSFETTRWLASAKLKQPFVAGRWRISPTLGVIYFEEEQQSYLDSNGLQIPEQTVSLGRFTFGPQIAYGISLSSGVYIEPQIGLTGIWDFVGSDKLIAGTAVDAEDIRARLDFGLSISDARSRRFEMKGFYDGIGDNGFEVFGGKAKLVLPL